MKGSQALPWIASIALHAALLAAVPALILHHSNPLPPPAQLLFAHTSQSSSLASGKATAPLPYLTSPPPLLEPATPAMPPLADSPPSASPWTTESPSSSLIGIGPRNEIAALLGPSGTGDDFATPASGASQGPFGFGNAAAPGNSTGLLCAATAPIAPPPILASPIPSPENPPPAYPADSRRRNHQGTALLLLEILPDGSVGYVELLTSAGHSDLDQAALQAVRLWKYTPATSNGQPTTVRVQIPIQFVLKS